MGNTTKPQFLITAPSSGSGKTSVCMGLMGLLTREEKKVQPFKCGPDYIDTKFHEMATGKPSVNLDTFMASKEHVKELYARYSEENDICIVEGVMGMFDGYDRDKGSSSEIAQLLDIPVVLVVDARSTAYSVAPLIYGFTHFNPNVRISGVIFNCVGSEKHGEMLKQACRDIHVECFGCILRNKDLQLKSRYLGLDISINENKTIIDAWSSYISGQVDVDRLLQKTLSHSRSYTNDKIEAINPEIRIAVAKNAESFAFIYAETLQKMRDLGEVIFFDPETAEDLPENIDLLYLPGGYPEKKQEQLKANSRICHQIRNYIEHGGRTLAECGGMVYLSKEIVNDENINQMAGVFPFRVLNTAKGRHISLGYRQFEYNGQKVKGHEFHYTQIAPDSHSLPSVAQIYNAANVPVDTPLFRYKNTIASYTHLYWGETDIIKLWD